MHNQGLSSDLFPPLIFREAENSFSIFLKNPFFFSTGNLKNAKNIPPCFLENCSEGGGINLMITPDTMWGKSPQTDCICKAKTKTLPFLKTGSLADILFQTNLICFWRKTLFTPIKKNFVFSLKKPIFFLFFGNFISKKFKKNFYKFFMGKLFF